MDRRPNEEILKKVRKFVQGLPFDIQQAFVFGSRARDDWLYTSDIDLIIVSRDFAEIPFLDRISKVAKEWDDIIELQPICYTPEEYERKKQQIGTVQQAAKDALSVA